MWQDFRFAARSLRRSPGFTAAALVTLAIGIGATTTVFSVISGVLLRPLPYREPDRLVMVWQEYVNRGWGIVGVSHANLVAIANQSKTLEALGGFQQHTVSFAEGDEAERLETATVTSGLFPMLGLTPAAGRLFTTDDERPGAERVAVLSDALWRRRFGADPAVLGRTISLNNEPHRIIGVMPRGSDFPPRFRMTLTAVSVTMPVVDVWTTLVLNPDPGRVGFRDTLVIGRLAPNVTLETARAEAALIAPALLKQFPGPANTGLTLAVVPLTEQVVGEVRRPLLLLFAAVALVVLIACANVASMLVARAASRQGESALRVALGASRGRLLRYVMAECLLLAGASAALGILLAVALTETLTTAIAASIPQFQGGALDVRLIGFAALLATTVALIFGIVPAAYTSTLAGGRWLSGPAKGMVFSPATAAMRRTLLACEAALALFLLVGAGLLVRSFIALVDVDAGFNPADKLAVGLTLPPALASTLDDRRVIYDALVSRLAAVPGVLSLGVSNSIPLTGDIGSGGLTIEGRALPASGERPHAAQRRVDPGYFDVMGMQMVRGRAFTAADRPGAPRVAIINESAARQFWPGTDPIGQRIRPDGFGDRFWLTIVGVVKDVRYAALSAAPDAEVYLPYALAPSPTIIAVIRSDVPAPVLSATIRREVRRLDARLPAVGVSTLDDVVAESVAESRLLVVLLALFALFGLAVSASGIYGVASYVVAQRQQDMAIRLALGASPQRVILVVLAEAVVPVIVGTAVGLIAAVVSSPIIADRLFDVSPTDPVTLATGPIILVGAALAACYGPARRAAGIDPVGSLRAQ